AAALGLPVSLHEEDPAFIESQGVNAGPTAEALELGGASALAEEVLVARDVVLAAKAGASLVIQHISSGNSVKILRAAKELGVQDIHAEATPHHFSLTEEAIFAHGTFARMNPPLRTEEDRLEIIRGLADGTIDLIATDHAPHTTEEKSRAFADAPSGIIGLETSLALGVTNLVRPGHLSLLELLRKMTVNPAKLLHLPKPRIAVGEPADLVLFAPEETFVAGNYASKAENSPFTGKTLYAPVKATICGGEIVYWA
ncbi:MAG: amidohydrolase family protein, partial [Lachnospiraceae bacterium]